MTNGDRVVSPVPGRTEPDSISVLIIGGLLGITLAVAVVPPLFPALMGSLATDQPKAFWYLSRSSAIVAYSLSWLAMMAGLGMTTRYGNRLPFGFTGFDIHRSSSLLALTAAAFHALILLGDRHLTFGLTSIMVPFSTADYRPLWVGLGQIGFYAMAIVTGTFWLRGHIGNRGWRIVHWTTFAVFLAVLVHGILAGTDSGQPLMSAWYWFTGSTVLLLTSVRIVAMVEKRQGR